MLIRFTAVGETIDWANGFGGVIFMSIVGGFVLGVFDFLANIAINNSRFRARSFGSLIVLKVIALIAGTTVVILFSRFVAAWSGETPWNDVFPSFFERLVDNRMLAAYLYVGVAAAVIAFVKQMSALVGGRVLINLVTGKYYEPKDEERIFMFLDLRASTSHAERLGNNRFCRLVQDCFRDLTDSAIRHQVEIHKYVGDEAILTWKVKDGVTDNNCLEVFFDFRDSLEHKRAFYEKRYGMFPEFKAGANVGTVTVLEIGVVKREIAYLSDVLNTAARIEGMCNEYGQDFLISGKLVEQLEKADGAEIYAFEGFGSIALRGRQGEIPLFGVTRRE